MSVRYSVVVPVYNAEASLQELCQRLHAALQDHSPDYEVILVDDASPDGSWAVLEALRQADPRVKIIQLMRNFGQHRATICGLGHAQGEFVVTMDDDLQHLPEDIPVLLAALESDAECDVVIGAWEKKRHSWFRNLGSWFSNRITSYVFGKAPGLQLTSLRAMRRCVVDAVLTHDTPRPRVGHLILMATPRIRNVKVSHEKRLHGQSGYTLRRLVSDALDNLLSHSSLPLQIVSYLGIGCAVLSLSLLIFFVCRYVFVGTSVTGWTSLMVVQLFFFGVLLLSFGVVGEYLIRILREIQSPPRVAIRRKEP